jgi:hypothetical protein
MQATVQLAYPCFLATQNFAQFVLDLLLRRVAIAPNEVFNFATSASMSALICTAARLRSSKQ